MIRMLTETRCVEIAPVSGWARWSHALLLLGVLVMVAVGLYLTPDPAGARHAPAVGAAALHDLLPHGDAPAPRAGLTTSVSAILHGQFRAGVAGEPDGAM